MTTRRQTIAVLALLVFVLSACWLGAIALSAIAAAIDTDDLAFYAALAFCGSLVVLVNSLELFR